jgi:hypothetical protein
MIDACTAATNSQWVFQTSVDVTLLLLLLKCSACTAVMWPPKNRVRKNIGFFGLGALLKNKLICCKIDTIVINTVRKPPPWEHGLGV